MTPKRPNPLRWLRYTYGGRLPDEYREWVRLDAAGPHWLLRHIVRVLVQILPVFVVTFVLLWVFTPAPPALVACALVVALMLSLLFMIGSADEFCEGRLVKHGFPPGSGPRFDRRDPGRRHHA